MIYKITKIAMITLLMMMSISFVSMADIETTSDIEISEDIEEIVESGPSLSSGLYIATITSESVNINKSYDSEEVLMTAYDGEVYQILESYGDGWCKVAVGDEEGYLPVSGNATVSSTGSYEQADSLTSESIREKQEDELRENVKDYALSLVGGRYAFGGTNPSTGIDCSGFTGYVMRNAAGISLARNSTGQSHEGRAISVNDVQVGDLLFYGGSGYINHVAIYIGDGKIVHASNARTGITVSAWNYRTPVKAVSVLG